MLLLNNQYRKESKNFYKLHKLFEKSDKIDFDSEGNKEKYTLLSYNPVYVITFENGMLSVSKGENLIWKVNCNWDEDELQEARFSMYSKLLEFARECKKKCEKTKKTKVNPVDYALERLARE